MMLYNMRDSSSEVVLYCVVDGIGRHDNMGSPLYSDMLKDTRSFALLRDRGIDESVLLESVERVHGKAMMHKVSRWLWDGKCSAAARALRTVR